MQCKQVRQVRDRQQERGRVGQPDRRHGERQRRHADLRATVSATGVSSTAVVSRLSTIVHADASTTRAARADHASAAPGRGAVRRRVEDPGEVADLGDDGDGDEEDQDRAGRARRARRGRHQVAAGALRGGRGQAPGCPGRRGGLSSREARSDHLVPARLGCAASRPARTGARATRPRVCLAMCDAPGHRAPCTHRSARSPVGRHARHTCWTGSPRPARAARGGASASASALRHIAASGPMPGRLTPIDTR